MHGLAAAMHTGDEAARAFDVQAGHFTDVGAADEGPVASAGEHQCVQRVVAGQFGHARDEQVHCRTVQAVGPADVVEGDMRDANIGCEGVDPDQDVGLGSAHGNDCRVRG